jgi:hypothetical protein
MTSPVRSQQGRTPGGPGLRCSGPDRRECSSERSLTSKTSWRSQAGLPVWTVGNGISPVDSGLARGNDGGRVSQPSPVTGATVWPRGRRDLEEEIEAQEGQGVGSRQRATTLQTIRTDNASKVPASQRAASVVSAMIPPVRSQQGRTPGGQGLQVTGALRAVGRILRGVVASRGSRLASAGRVKRDEPQGRLQDATSLRALARRNPARW